MASSAHRPPSTPSIASTAATAAAKPAPAPLHRRLLFPHLPASQPTPPLLRTASPVLSAELYAFLALALRAHITPWWSRLTRYDRDFLPHVASILAHVFRALETRLLAADLTHALFRAVPALVAQHYDDYRAAEARVGSAYASGGALGVPDLFHQMQPHMAVVDAEGRLDPAYIRHTVDLILEACLPPEDYASSAERAIIREVVVKIVLQDVVPLLVQPWFAHKLVLDLLRRSAGSEKAAAHVPSDALPSSSKTSHASTPAASRGSGPSIHSVVVFVLSTVQYLSGLCLAIIQLYKQSVHTIRQVKVTSERKRMSALSTSTTGSVTPGYGASIIYLASTIMTLEKRSASKAMLILVELLNGLFASFTDRAVWYAADKYVFTEETVLAGVKAARETLYPNGYPGPPPVMPTPEEQGVMREKVITQVLERVPGWVGVVVLGPDTGTARSTVEEVLAPLSCAGCNAHLVVLLLDLVVATLFPELAVQVPVDVVESRASVVVGSKLGGALQSSSSSGSGSLPLSLRVASEEDSSSVALAAAASA